jgi:protein required for attachment to host cells
MTWAIVLDAARCRIFELKNFNHIRLIKAIDHPENKLRDIDLTTDKPGHYKASNSNHGAFVQQTDPKEILLDNFSRDIAKELDKGRIQHAYKRLIIIAPPHMCGLLSKHINKHVDQLITHRINKDVMHLPEHELLGFIAAHAQYPG